MMRTTLIACALLVVAGCEFFRDMEPPSAVAPADPAAELLASAALRAEAALAELAQARSAPTPPAPAAPRPRFPPPRRRRWCRRNC